MIDKEKVDVGSYGGANVFIAAKSPLPWPAELTEAAPSGRLDIYVMRDLLFR